MKIRYKLILVTMLICGIVILLIGATVVVWTQGYLRKSMLWSLSTQAEIIADNCKTAVASNASSDAGKILSILKTQKSIVCAVIYNSKGEVFADYYRDDSRDANSLPRFGAETKQFFGGGSLVSFRQVVLDGEAIAVVAIKSDISSLKEALWSGVTTILYVLAAAFLLAYLLSSKLQAIISRPITALAGVAKTISEEKKYSIRASKQTNDEIGMLIDSFNEMLNQIQRRDLALTEANEQLEMRVKERTAELTEEIAERRLAESRLQLTQFSIDNSSDSVLRINSNGKIVYANTAACRSYGYSREELLERYIWDIDLNFSRNGWEDRRQDVRQKGTSVFESLSRTKAGKVFPAEVSLLYIEFEGSEYICAFLRDISERKRIEEARIKQVERVKRQESAIVRISTNQSLNIGSVRDAMQVITEITADTMRVERASVWLLNNEHTQMECIDLFERSTQMHSCGMKLRASDYPRYFASLTMGRTIDVPDACADQRTSEFAKEYLVPLGIISILDTVIRVSGEVVGIVCHESVGHKRIWDSDELTFAGEIADQAAQTLINTDRKKAQGELEEVNNQLQTTVQKLEESNQELKNFVYIASHDLREPLRKISAFGIMLQKSLESKIAGDDSENLNFMVDGAARMSKMIEGLLVYSRVSTKVHSAEAVNLNNIVKEIGQLELSVAIEEKKAVLDVPQPLPEVEVDPVQIRQLMQNLIANGMKYQAKGNTPHITITSRPAADGMVRINIIDNGIGIAPEYQQAIFVMFKRLHSRSEYEGTGIGLAVCKKIVERHNGQIGVESEPGKGSTFWFTLPAASRNKVREPAKKEDRPVVN